MTKEEHFFFKDFVFPQHTKSIYFKGKRYSKEDIIKIKNIFYKKNTI